MNKDSLMSHLATLDQDHPKAVPAQASGDVYQAFPLPLDHVSEEVRGPGGHDAAVSRGLRGPSLRLRPGLSELAVAQPPLGEGPGQNGHLFRAGWENEARRNDPRLPMWRVEEHDKEIRRTEAKRRSEGTASFSDTITAPESPMHPVCLRLHTCRTSRTCGDGPSWQPGVRRSDNGDILKDPYVSGPGTDLGPGPVPCPRLPTSL